MSGLPLIRPAAQPRRALRTPVGAIARWIELRSTRAALARLDPRLLRDIGLSEGLAQREAARPFWHE